MAGAGKDRPGSMVAVLGLSTEQIAEVLAAVNAPRDLAAANYNSPGQVVLSGTVEALDRAEIEAKRLGAKKLVRLQVSAAFHSPLMEGAARLLNEALERVAIARPAYPVYANVTAAPVHEPEEIRRTLMEQLLRPVLWEPTLRALLDAGFRQFVEVGNGRVLRGLVRSLDRDAGLWGSEDPDAVELTVQGLLGAPTR
jgi:[acyl-carrier-protein] S-malonyltransferase